jgi:hypothetical protein
VGKALAVVAAGTVLAGLAITSPELAVQGTCNCARPALRRDHGERRVPADLHLAVGTVKPGRRASQAGVNSRAR